ncbi:unnamed protein product [Arctogadus glacialis]
MSAPMEVIVSTDSSSLLWNCTVSDLHSGAKPGLLPGGKHLGPWPGRPRRPVAPGGPTGQELHQRVGDTKEGPAAPEDGVSRGGDNCLTAAPNGLFLAAGIAEALYLWEVVDGQLLPVLLNRHLPGRQLCEVPDVTDDSSHLVTGEEKTTWPWCGDEGLNDGFPIPHQRCDSWMCNTPSCGGSVIEPSVVQLDQGCSPEPLHVLSRHSLPVTDLHCGLMGPQARLATASLDQTVKLWELGSGELLLSILFDVSIMSVTLDPCEYFLFCGGSDGNIFQVSLCSQSLSRDKTFQSESDGNQVFKGHRNLVSCLSVSMDGTLLLSGSHDETMRLWDVQSRQSLRCSAQKGQVTTCSIMAAPANMLVPLGASAAPLPRLSRHLASSQHAEGPASGDVCLRLGLHTQEEESYLQKAEKLFSTMTAITDKRVGDEDGSRVRLAELEEEVRTLKKVNKDLYSFSAQLLT